MRRKMCPVYDLTTDIPQLHHLPRPTKTRQAPFANKQFLHGALFNLAFFGNELLKGFDEGIGITQGLGDGLLFGLGWGEWDDDLMQIIAIDSWHTAFPTVSIEV